jgi:hypothetical protein
MNTCSLNLATDCGVETSWPMLCTSALLIEGNYEYCDYVRFQVLTATSMKVTAILMESLISCLGCSRILTSGPVSDMNGNVGILGRGVYVQRDSFEILRTYIITLSLGT